MRLTISFKGSTASVKQKNDVLYKGNRRLYNREATFSITTLENRTIATIIQYKSFFRPKYEIITYGSDRIVFEMINKCLIKGYWVIETTNEIYEIISHIGTGISIFKNGDQMASISVDRHASNPKTVIVTYNRAENDVLLTCIAIAIFGSFYNALNSITFSFGHIGFQVKKTDQTWKATD